MHGEAWGSTSVFNLEPFDGIKCSFPRSGGMEILGWLWQRRSHAAAIGMWGLGGLVKRASTPLCTHQAALGPCCKG